MRRLRVPLILLIVIYSVSVLGFVLIPGEDDQGNVWRMSFFHAFYFVSYMGSTIGFGEIPYEFTNAQRMWTMLTIYASVIGWLYSIGSLLAVFQDPAFTKLRREYLFLRQVRGVRSPFYLICGFGEAGSTLVRALADVEIKSIVIDNNQNRINELELGTYARRPLGLTADAALPRVLQGAGVQKANCLGAVALTDSDQTNLLIALSTFTLSPDLQLLSRAETSHAEKNIRSFGNNIAVNPFETFADQLYLLLNRPSHYILSEWVSSTPDQNTVNVLQDWRFPRKGRWVLAGFGRFGRAIFNRLQDSGIEVCVIELDANSEGLPENHIIGHGTEADTLMEAGIDMSVGIIAGTDDDAANLSILLTARDKNPSLFLVARQNERENELIFNKSKFNMVMKYGDVIAHRVFALLHTPLISDFLKLAAQENREWANILVSRILGVMEGNSPYFWEIHITLENAPARYHSAPAVHQACENKQTVKLKDILRNPRARQQQLSVIPLILKRGGEAILLPDINTSLKTNDRLLMCASHTVSHKMDWSIQNEGILYYLLTGEEVFSSWFWRWLQAKKQKSLQPQNTHLTEEQSTD